MATEAQIRANRRLSTVLGPLHLSRTLYKSAHFMQNKPNLLDAQMNVSSILTKDYENEFCRKLRKNKPNLCHRYQTQPVVSLSNLFQTGHLLVNRMKPKFFNFACKNSLTGWRNSLKCWFSYGERSYNEEFYGKEDMMAKRPEKVVELAVRRMLPKNKLGRKMLKRLKVYRGPEHEHQAQKPENIELFQ